MHCTESAGGPGFFHTPSKTKYLDLQVLPASNKGNTNYFNSSTSYFQTLNLKTSFSYFCPYFLSYNLFLPYLFFLFLTLPSQYFFTFGYFHILSTFSLPILFCPNFPAFQLLSTWKTFWPTTLHTGCTLC